MDNYETSEALNTVSERITPSTQHRPFAGFWKRLLALLIDSVILGVFGFVLGLVAGEFFVQLGGWGRLVGFGVAVAYLGILNSRLAGGRTVGKAILRLRVVDRDGHAISLPRSLARSALLVVPFFLNRLAVPITSDLQPILTVVGVMIFALGSAIPYLYVFNRRTRQSLHDLVFRTYVVKTSSQGVVGPGRIARVHYVVVGVLFLVSIALPFAGLFVASSMGQYLDMSGAVERLNKTSGVQTASLFRGEVFGGGQKPVSYVRVEVWTARPVTREFAGEIASIVLDSYPRAREVDFLDVTVLRGFDIGIAASSGGMRTNLPPSQWMTANIR